MSKISTDVINRTVIKLIICLILMHRQINSINKGSFKKESKKDMKMFSKKMILQNISWFYWHKINFLFSVGHFGSNCLEVSEKCASPSLS